MIFLVLSMVIGLASGYLYAAFFIKRYAWIAHHKLQPSQQAADSMPMVRQLSTFSFVRHILLTAVLAFLFLYVKLHLISWLIGFLFAFWYGVLSIVKRKEKS